MKRTNSILIVDDDDRVRELFATCLRAEGYDVLEASGGLEGFDLARRHLPDLVILDVKLPDISGVEVCKRIKGDSTLADVFVALCSGEATGIEHKVDGLQTADEYLVKPFGLQELLARVRTLLRLRDTAAALRANEEHYRRLIDILPDAVCLISPEGRLISVNSQAVAMLGYDNATELLNKSVFDLVSASERSKTNVSDALKNRIVRNVEYTLLKKDGTPLQVELSATVTAGKDGMTAGFVCVARDVTERKQAEQILRDSEERFRQLADNIREVFWMSDAAKGELIYVSPAYEVIWGRKRDNLHFSTEGWLETIHPDDRRRIQDAKAQQISGEYNEVYRIVRPDETMRWIQDRAFPIQDDSGKVYRVVGIAEDITERKAIWDALLENEARKSAIMRVALDAIITIDHNGRIIELNSAAEKIFTHNRTKLVGENVTDIIPSSLRQWFRDGLDNYFAGEKGPTAGSRIEMPVLRADGGRFYAEFTITRIKLKGEPMFTLYIRDITQRKRAEEELRLLPQRVIKAQEAERLRVARELHDGVNQIIASVKMRLRHVQAGLPTPQAAAREILTRCDRLLAKALEENRRIAHNLHPADLDNLGFSTACHNLCKEFQARTNLQVKYRIAIPAKIQLPPNIELSLFRIVQEAINNIEKYAQAKTVNLQIKLQDDFIFLKIQDDGRGFDTKKTKSDKREQGHGLGLTNMRERALSLGGTCEMLSSPKKGTTIVVRIPCVADEEKNFSKS